MTTSLQKTLAQQWFSEAYNEGKVELARTLFSPEAVFNGKQEGPAGPTTRSQGFRNVFPDIHAEISQMIEEDNLLFIRWRAVGTQQATFNGIPATGKQISTVIFVVWRFENGQVVEDWTTYDRLAILEQLGRGLL
jgi:steroid delta-isomerase-like uncharacterized protein